MGPRLMNWEERLDAVLRDPRSFEWGVSDCCKFAARCVAAIRGRDPSERWSYVDEFGASRILRQYGGIEGIATFILGPSTPPQTAGRGDIVLVDAPRRMLGVCIGHLVAVQGEQGIEYIPRSAALMAWRV
jgi:hypothetical protein